MRIVSKFGGSSLADASQIKKVIAIIQASSSRRTIVVSAPGKRHHGDRKVTDCLYGWHRLNQKGLSFPEVKDTVTERFKGIVKGLGIKFDVDREMDGVVRQVRLGAGKDYLASRGECLMAKILAVALGHEFVDPATCIRLSPKGTYLPDADLARALEGKRTVVAGFYGSLQDGSIKTFSRGGSDITGAIVASAISADLSENWTDVSGLLMADPRVVANPKTIGVVTYEELRELAYMGANVFHEEAMFPVQDANIVTRILNTNNPDDLGTRILPSSDKSARLNRGEISGIAGRKNFTIIKIEKRLMDREIGFGRRVLGVIADNGISFEHMPGGIDTLSVIIDDRQLGEKTEKVVNEIKNACAPDRIKVERGVALIAVVGCGMIHRVGASARVLNAIARAGINIKVISQGSSELSIIVGVRNCDYKDAVRAVYRAFVGKAD